MSPPRALVSLIAVAAVAAPAGVGAVAGGPAAPAIPRPAVRRPSPRRWAPGWHARDGAAARAGDPSLSGARRGLRRPPARQPDPGPAPRLRAASRPSWRAFRAGAPAVARERGRPAGASGRGPATRPRSRRCQIESDRSGAALRADGEADREPAALFKRGGWGLAVTGAPAVWRDYGLDGRGVRVGSIDTGVDADHPDLAGKVVAWRDFVDGRPEPYDDHGHGTHTIGTMVGGAAAGRPSGWPPGRGSWWPRPSTPTGPPPSAGCWPPPSGSPTPTATRSRTTPRASSTPPGERRRAPAARRCGAHPALARPGDRAGLLAGQRRARAERGRPGGLPRELRGRGPRPRRARCRLLEPGPAPRGRPAGPAASPAAQAGSRRSGHRVVSSVPGGAWWEPERHLDGGAPRHRSDRAPAPGRSRDLRRRHRDDPARDRARRRGCGPRPAQRRGRPGRPRRRRGRARATGPASGGLGDRGAAGPDQSGGPHLRCRERRRAAWRLARRCPRARRPVRPLRARAGSQARPPRRRRCRARSPRCRAGAPRRFSGDDRSPAARLRLAVRRTGLLEIDYRADAAGVAERSVRSRLSDGGDRRRPSGPAHLHRARALLGRGSGRRPGGNVRRLRRALSWPPALVARRLAWNEAFSILRVAFPIARRSGGAPDATRPARAGAPPGRLLGVDAVRRDPQSLRATPPVPSASGATGEAGSSSRSRRRAGATSWRTGTAGWGRVSRPAAGVGLPPAPRPSRRRGGVSLEEA